MPFIPALQHVPANLAGRNFVVGDLHGMRASLDHALAQVDFDPRVDRLFSVGDLVDRGPDPMGCLRLLREPWFFAVRGNHERMLLAHLGYPETWVTRFHGHRYSRVWVQALCPADRQELIEDLAPRVAQLPLALRSTGPQGTFYVLHAERRLRGQVLTDAALDQALAGSLEAVPRALREALTWSRQGFIQAQTSDPVLDLPGVSRTYVGHTITPALQAAGHVYLDRGAYAHPVGQAIELQRIS